MPVAMIASIAQKSGKSKAEVEKLWNETKAQAKKKFKTEDEHYWAYVNTVTQRKSGIKESLTFKDYLLETSKKKKEPAKQEEPKVEYKVGDNVKVVKAFKVGDMEVGLGEVFQVQAIADNGDLQLANAWGVEDQAKFVTAKHFEKVS